MKFNKNLILKLLLFLGLIFFVGLSFQASISGDEDIHAGMGERVLNYFTSGGEDKSYRDTYRGPDYAYNFTFDVFCEIVQRITGIEDIHTLRHFFNSIIGWLIVLISTVVSKKYFGWNAALFTILFFLISPRFIGHSLNNPKDIPFAFGYMLSLWAILKFCEELPQPSWKTVLLVGGCIGLCLNFRIGGLLLIAYTGLFALVKLYLKRGKSFMAAKYWNQDYGKLLLKGAVIAVVAYILMVITWPFALEKPLKNPFEALDIMTNFAVGIRQLFEGVNVTSSDLPSNYIYKWMYMTIPIVILIGLVIVPFAFFKIKKPKKKRGFVLFVMVFALVFPICYAIYKNSNVYGGWRHFIFTYPPLIILAAAGYDFILKLFKNKFIQYGTYGLVGVLALNPMLHIVKNHPVEYVYFNELSGGLDKAYGQYEMDYYMHSLRPAVKWLESEGIINDQDSIILATNHSYSIKYYTGDKPNVKTVYTRYYERNNKDWDYGIYVNVYIDQAELENKQFPPTGTIHTIDVEGYPMCAIVKRPSKTAIGYQKDLKDGNIKSAKQKLQQYYETDKDNFEVNINLALIYNKLQKRDSLQFFLREAKRVNSQRFARYVKQ